MSTDHKRHSAAPLWPGVPVQSGAKGPQLSPDNQVQPQVHRHVQLHAALPSVVPAVLARFHRPCPPQHTHANNNNRMTRPAIAGCPQEAASAPHSATSSLPPHLQPARLCHRCSSAPPHGNLASATSVQPCHQYMHCAGVPRAPPCCY